jgi:hypothetical protein
MFMVLHLLQTPFPANSGEGRKGRWHARRSIRPQLAAGAGPEAMEQDNGAGPANDPAQFPEFIGGTDVAAK